MKLDAKNVRMIAPFWPTVLRRTLRFTGRRNTIHLQETAMVAEGELLLFPCLGLERIFGRVLSAWSTVTIPYSRIESVHYRARLALRLTILAFLAAILGFALETPWTDPAKWNWLLFSADLLLLAPFIGVAALAWWRIKPTYACTFRLKDGKSTRFHFAVRSKAHRREFDDAMSKFRKAAQEHTLKGGG